MHYHNVSTGKRAPNLHTRHRSCASMDEILWTLINHPLQGRCVWNLTSGGQVLPEPFSRTVFLCRGQMPSPHPFNTSIPVQRCRMGLLRPANASLNPPLNKSLQISARFQEFGEGLDLQQIFPPTTPKTDIAKFKHGLLSTWTQHVLHDRCSGFQEWSPPGTGILFVFGI